MQDIEAQVEESTDERLEGVDEDITVRQRKSTGFGEIARTMITTYPKRSILGVSLFVGQAFLYNAVFFTFALVLTKMLHVSDSVAPWYLIPLAIGNFLGPLLLGKFFDTVGRRVMITGTYVLSGLLLILTGVLFNNGALTANTLTLAWCIVFFFASAGASAAYLTVSEIFPMETRAMAIAFFYAVGTGLGGIIGPVLFGKFIEQGRGQLVFGYYIGAGLMIAAGLVELFLGVNAEQRSSKTSPHRSPPRTPRTARTPSTSPPTTTTRSTYAARSASWSAPERDAIPGTARARCAATTEEAGSTRYGVTAGFEARPPDAPLVRRLSASVAGGTGAARCHSIPGVDTPPVVLSAFCRAGKC